MKTKRIGHCKTYKPYEFVYEKIELSEDFPIDKSDEECIKELIERIENMAKVAYPSLYQQEKSFVSALAASLKNAGNPYQPVEAAPLHTPSYVNKLALIDTPPPPEEQKPLLQLIQESSTVKELKSWELLIKVERDTDKRKELQKAYDEKMLELTKEQTIPNKV